MSPKEELRTSQLSLMRQSCAQSALSHEAELHTVSSHEAVQAGVNYSQWTS